MMPLRFLFFINFILVSNFGFCQDSYTDSLLNALKKTNKADTVKVAEMEIIVADFFNAGEYDKTISLAKQGIIWAQRFDRPKSKGYFLHYMGKAYQEKAEFQQALNSYQQALSVREEIGDSLGMAKTLGNIGNTYNSLSDYAKAVDMELRSVKICEKIKAEDVLKKILSSLGVVYYSKGEYLKALEYHMRSLKLEEKSNDKIGIGLALGNIGRTYFFLDSLDKAFWFQEKSLKIVTQENDRFAMSNALAGLAEIYQKKKEYKRALAYYSQSKKICEEDGDQVGTLSAALSIGILYTLTNKLNEAELISKEAVKLSKEFGLIEYEKEAYNNLREIYDKCNKPLLAYNVYKKYVLLKDSINSEASQKAMVQHEMSYEFDKKEAGAKLEQEKKDAIASAESRRQLLILWLIGIAGAGVTVVAFLVYRSLRQNKKTQIIIETQKAEVEQKNILIEHKQKEIVDSITYAQRIQNAILPPLNDVDKALPGSFVLFKPKDIVSGDFFWFAQKENKILIAAADCTGHGVPGAIMSMLCSDKLNESVIHSADISTILQSVNVGLKKALRQSDKADSTRDGMDIALCSFNKEMTYVEYAAANRPLWIIRNGKKEVEETKATKTAIGGFTEDDQIFAKHRVELQKGDTIYIFTDGYADQFSADDKKLMTKKFKTNLLEIQSKPMFEQKEFLDTFIENWKGGMEQTDDILVIGIRI